MNYHQKAVEAFLSSMTPAQLAGLIAVPPTTGAVKGLTANVAHTMILTHCAGTPLVEQWGWALAEAATHHPEKASDAWVLRILEMMSDLPAEGDVEVSGGSTSPAELVGVEEERAA